MISVLFVCLGNICRSPVAEVVFKHLVKKAGLEKEFKISSCGTSSWNSGSPAHYLSRESVEAHGLNLDSHVAKQIKPSDFGDYDYILALDTSVYETLKASRYAGSSNISFLRSYQTAPDSMDVPDPFYMPDEGFALVYDIILDSCEGFLKKCNRSATP